MIRRFIASAFILCLFSGIALAQKISVDKIDKFSKSHIIETKSEVLWKPKPFTKEHKIIEVTLRWVDGEWVLPTLISIDDVLKYEEGDGMTLLLDNGETIVLETIYTGISGPSYTGHLQGAVDMLKTFSTVFNISTDQIELLKQHNVTDVRISALGKYYDLELSDKNKNLLSRMITLIENKLIQ